MPSARGQVSIKSAVSAQYGQLLRASCSSLVIWSVVASTNSDEYERRNFRADAASFSARQGDLGNQAGSPRRTLTRPMKMTPFLLARFGEQRT